MRARRLPLFAAVALLALASVGAMLAEEAFVHTDDGCAVEVHCLACRLAVAGAGVVTLAPLPLRLALAGWTPPAPPLAAPRDAAPALLPSRSPPSV